MKNIYLNKNVFFSKINKPGYPSIILQVFIFLVTTVHTASYLSAVDLVSIMSGVSQTQVYLQLAENAIKTYIPFLHTISTQSDISPVAILASFILFIVMIMADSLSSLFCNLIAFLYPGTLNLSNNNVLILCTGSSISKSRSVYFYYTIKYITDTIVKH